MVKVVLKPDPHLSAAPHRVKKAIGLALTKGATGPIRSDIKMVFEAFERCHEGIKIFRGGLLAGGVASQYEQELQPGPWHNIAAAQIGQPVDISLGVEDVLNGDIMIPLFVIKARYVWEFSLAQHFADRDGDGTRLNVSHQFALLLRAIQANGLCGDLGLHVWDGAGQLGKQLAVETSIKAVPLLSIPHMGMDAVGPGLPAGARVLDGFGDGDRQSRMVGLGAPRPVGRDHDFGQGAVILVAQGST